MRNGEMLKMLKTILTGSIVCLAGLCLAQEGTNSTVITSKTMELDYKRSIAVFEQNVVVQDPQVNMECDRLVVMFEQDQGVKSATATGNVRLKSEDRTAACDRAVYVVKTGQIVLTGNAKLTRGKDILEGKEMTFWIDDERVECDAGRLVLFPSKEQRASAARFSFGQGLQKPKK